MYIVSTYSHVSLHIRCGQVARWVGGCGHIAQWVGGRSRLNMLAFLFTRDCCKSTFETSPNSMKYVFGSLGVESSVATHILILEISEPAIS